MTVAKAQRRISSRDRNKKQRSASDDKQTYSARGRGVTGNGEVANKNLQLRFTQIKTLQVQGPASLEEKL